jgi:hypothetical protein
MKKKHNLDSFILGFEIDEITDCGNTIYFIEYGISGYGIKKEVQMNVFEYTHKLKEYARDNNFLLKSYWNCENKPFVEKKAYATLWSDKHMHNKSLNGLKFREEISFSGDSEYEAVNNACVWIFKNINKIVELQII